MASDDSIDLICVSVRVGSTFVLAFDIYPVFCDEEEVPWLDRAFALEDTLDAAEEVRFDDSPADKVDSDDVIMSAGDDDNSAVLSILLLSSKLSVADEWFWLGVLLSEHPEHTAFNINTVIKQAISCFLFILIRRSFPC